MLVPDPNKRAKLSDLRSHPWMTKNGPIAMNPISNPPAQPAIPPAAAMDPAASKTAATEPKRTEEKVEPAKEPLPTPPVKEEPQKSAPVSSNGYTAAPTSEPVATQPAPVSETAVVVKDDETSAALGTPVKPTEKKEEDDKPRGGGICGCFSSKPYDPVDSTAK